MPPGSLSTRWKPQVLALVTGLLAAVSPLSAGDDDGAPEASANRVVDITIDSDSWSVVSNGTTDGVADTLFAEAAVLDAPWAFRYRADAATPTLELPFSLRFHRVVEFLDVDGDGRLGLGDLVDQQIRVRDLVFPLTSHQERDGVHNLSVSQSFQQPTRGTFTVTQTFRSFTDPTANVTPLDVEFRIGIHGFQTAGDNSTHLAVVMQAGPNPTLMAGRVQTQDSLSILDLRWNATGFVDGVSKATGITVESNSGGGAAVVVVSLPIGESWAAKGRLSVLRKEEVRTPAEVIEEVLGDWRPYVVGIVAAGVLTAATAYFRLRRSR